MALVRVEILKGKNSEYKIGTLAPDEGGRCPLPDETDRGAGDPAYVGVLFKGSTHEDGVPFRPLPGRFSQKG